MISLSLSELESLKKSLYEWILKISSVESGPICPFALKSWINNEVRFVYDSVDLSTLVPLEDNISVCVVLMAGASYDDLVDISNEYNEKFPEYLFLDTHPEETLTLRGMKTVWDHPGIIIQRRSELLEARNRLLKSGFYKNWDKDLLDSLGINIENDSES